MKNLYLVGFDSVPLWILDAMRNEKGMNALDTIFKKGSIVEMESTLPPMSGPAWPTIYTGVEPSVHGVPDFFVMKRDYTPDIVLYDSTDVAPFWKTLSEKGHRCLIITPPEEVKITGLKNVDIITGFPLPAKTNSAALRKMMDKHKFNGEPDIEKYIKAGKMTEKEAVKHFVKSVRARAEIAKDALRGDYDFAYVCFTETDRIQHFLLNQKDWKETLLPIYAEYSAFLDYMIKRVDKEGSALIVLSDHGSQPIRNKFLMNCWLVRNGYLNLNRQIGEKLESKGSANTLYGIREKLLRTRLRRIYDGLPYGLKRVAFKILETSFQGASAGEYTRLHLFDYDMKKSVAFAAISNDPVTTIWINDGRFVNGCVPKTEREKTKRALKEALSKVKSRDGSKMFTNIIDGKDYYGKTDKFMAPDLLVEAKEGYTIDIFNFSKDTTFQKPEPAKGGDHSRKGIFGYYSDSVSINTKNMRVSDVHDIILNYFKLGKKGRLKFV